MPSPPAPPATLKEDYARIVAAADAAGTAAKLETALEELVHFAEAGTAAHAVNTPLAEIMDECVRWVERLKRSKSGIWSASHEERTEVITRNARHILKAYDDFLASAAGAIVRGDKGAGDAAAEGEGSAVPPPRRRGVSFAAIGQGTSFIRHGTVCEPTSEPFASHYDVGEELGRGSYSVVRRAVHKRSQQECAVKIIDRAKLSKHDKEALENEVSIMCQVRGFGGCVRGAVHLPLTTSLSPCLCVCVCLFFAAEPPQHCATDLLLRGGPRVLPGHRAGRRRRAV